MSVNIDELRRDATDAVLTRMLQQFEEADADAMREFAATIAEAAAAAVQHILDHARTEHGRERIR